MHCLAPVLAVLLLSGCDRPQLAPQPDPRVAVYQVGETVVQGELQFYGRVVPADLTRIAFRIPGKIAELPVQAGQRVQAGQVLARIDDSIQRQVLADARAQFELSRRQLQRAEKLYQQGTLTAAQLDQLQAGFRLATARFEQARASLSYTVIRAPFDGAVDHVDKELHESASAGETIATVYRTDRTDVLVDMPDSLTARVHEGIDPYAIEVQAKFSGSEELHTMRLLKGSTARNPSTQAFEYWLTMPAAGKPVPPGLTVTLTLDLQKAGFNADAGFLVPLTALQAGSRSDAFQVWRVENGQVNPVAVRVGQLTEQGALVLSGLRQGDRIVAGGLSRLSAGQQVSVVGQE